MVTARTIAHKTQTKGLCKYIMIDAKEPEEKAMMAMMILACTIVLVLILKANFITKASGKRKKGRRELEGECWRKRLREGKEPLAKNNGIITATEYPWFLVKGKNLLVREVSVRLLLLALLEDQEQTNKALGI
jgi:hypothetical protein